MRPGVTVIAIRRAPRQERSFSRGLPAFDTTRAPLTVTRPLAKCSFGTVITDRLFAAKRLVVEPARRDVCGTFEKGGDLTLGAGDVGDQDPTGAGRVQVHTCVVTFPDGTAASVIVNSPLGGPDYQCVVLRKAWAAAL